MVDDYTAKMTELIELMRLIGNDTQQCEVKECKRKISSTITDTLSAFSNGSGGWIILGLSEKNGFTPVEGFDARAMQEALSQACEKMTPVVRPVIVTCPFEGANLVFARIDEMLPRDKPCFTTALGPHGGSFIRTGDGDRRMTSYEVDRLIEEHLQPTYDLDIVPDATTDDLDPQLVAGLLARVREQHPRVFADRDGIDVLLDPQVLRHDDSDESEVGGILRPTLAGLLALGRYPQKFYPRLGISIAVFPGTSRDDVFRGDERLVASKSVVGSIPVMIDDAVDSLMRWIGAKKPDYPPLVLREAIANALTHRDYSPDARGTQVHISVFTDRIEITNPGGLYGMVTHDVLASPHPVTGAVRLHPKPVPVHAAGVHAVSGRRVCEPGRRRRLPAHRRRVARGRHRAGDHAQRHQHVHDDHHQAAHDGEQFTGRRGQGDYDRTGAAFGHERQARSCANYS